MTRNYLVKWKALPYEDCTWELEEDVDPAKIKQHEVGSRPFCCQGKRVTGTLRLVVVLQIVNRIPPRTDPFKGRKRPRASDWKKLETSPVYMNGNTLREYQLEGLNWLSFSWYNGRNCILADEMGLGKTIQSLTFIESVHRTGIRGPFLVIAPLSTIPNWQREFETWTSLNVIVYHGSAASRNMLQEYEFFFKQPENSNVKPPKVRPGPPSASGRCCTTTLTSLDSLQDLYKFNVLITTFEMIISDCFELREVPWRLCVIDEAHRLKNKNCKLLEGLRLLQLEHRVLLSGTPLQNNISELYSLLNFLEPTQFQSSEDFIRDFGDLKSDEQVNKLQALLKPMMLRRLKEDVEKSLAPKEETIIEVELTNMQKKYYRGILERNFSFLTKGTTNANIPNLMNTMMELRKCCIHPYLLNGAEEQIQHEMKVPHSADPDLHQKCLIQSSGKLVLVDKLLPKLRSNGHRVLIFSQMVRCLDILEDYLIFRKYPYERLDGRIRGNMRQVSLDGEAAGCLFLFLYERLLFVSSGGHRPFLQARLGPVRVLAVHQGRRSGHQPDGRRHGHHLRLGLEPAERPAGAGALPPHRPAKDGQSLPAAHAQHIRARDVRQGLAQARPRQGCPPGQQLHLALLSLASGTGKDWKGVCAAAFFCLAPWFHFHLIRLMPSWNLMLSRSA